MAIKNLGFTVDVNGISPSMITDAGTQGDHKATRVKFILSEQLYQDMNKYVSDGNMVLYRFDVYNGEGGIWQSDAVEWDSGISLDLMLEECHTRFGGKITVYLVMTALSLDNETQVELYSFPAVLQLKNRPEGQYQERENYESVSGLLESAKASALAAETSNLELQGFVAHIEEKLKNGEFDGVGVQSVRIINDELVITYTNGVVENLGNVKGEKGDAGKDAVTDQSYSATSENAQSGKAVTEALNSYAAKSYVDNLDCVQSIERGLQNGVGYTSIMSPDGNCYIEIYDDGTISTDGNRLIYVPTPKDDTDAVNKSYVDEMCGNKVERITLDNIATADDYELGIYSNSYDVSGDDGTYYDGKTKLIKASKGTVPNTIPMRDATGAISVSINIKDSEGNNYVGGASPHTWVNDRLNELNERLYDFKSNASEEVIQEGYAREKADTELQNQIDSLKATGTELNLLKSIVEGKKITKYTISAGESLILKKNAAYIFLRDGSENSVSIYNNGTLQYEGTDNELTFETGIVIIPDNTMGSSVQYPPSYYSLAIKMTSVSLLGAEIPSANSAKFSVLKEVMEAGGLVAKENSGSSTISVWEIAL